MGRATVHRSRARRGDGALLRAEILAAAERLLIASGDETAVSIRAVALAVGVTSPSIYLHFADRNELIFAVCEEQFRHLDEVMDQAVGEATDPWERIERRGHAYVQFGLDNPEHYRVMFSSRPNNTPERFMDERLIATSAFGHLIEDLQAAAAAGQLGPASGLEDAALVASGLWMMVHGITSLLISKPDFPWPDQGQLVDHVLQTYATGLKSRPLPSGRVD
jgi:AcrR family transcriptional regulator